MGKTQFVLSTLLYFCASACSHAPTSALDCPRHLRALVDVGSGTTKLSLAEVAVCASQVHVVRWLDEESSRPVAFEAGKDQTGALSPEVQALGIKALAELREAALMKARHEAPQFKHVEFVAVGTQAIRSATNGDEFAARVRHEVGFVLTALSQQSEGENGWLGVQSKGLPSECQSRRPVVWDIGGGSQQITRAEAGRETWHVEKVSFGAEGFKRALLPLRERASRCEWPVPTPNPIGWKNASTAEQRAAQMARTALAADFNIDPKLECVIGIGGVHEKAVEAMIHRHWADIKPCACAQELNVAQCEAPLAHYSRHSLQCLAVYLADKNDCDPALKGPYSTTAVSNLFLVLGFMERLKINEIYTMNVNMGAALITDHHSLPWRSVSTSEVH